MITQPKLIQIMQPKLDWKPPSSHGGFGFADQIWRSPHGDSWAPTKYRFRITCFICYNYPNTCGTFFWLTSPSGNLRCRAPVTSTSWRKTPWETPRILDLKLLAIDLAKMSWFIRIFNFTHRIWRCLNGVSEWWLLKFYFCWLHHDYITLLFDQITIV